MFSNTVLPGSRAPWYALMIVLAVVIAVIGHDLLHTVQRWLTYVMISVFAVLTVAALGTQLCFALALRARRLAALRDPAAAPAE